MAVEVIWLPKAELKFQQVIDYLNENWTEREIRFFVSPADKTIKTIQQFPGYSVILKRKIFMKQLLQDKTPRRSSDKNYKLL